MGSTNLSSLCAGPQCASPQIAASVDPELRPDAPAAAKRSWHRLYYALGAFNVASVLVAIPLGYAAMAGFSTSVDVNARWAAAVAGIDEMFKAPRH